MTVKVTLAKALKLKNRLTGRIAKLQQEIRSYNSRAEGTEAPDVKEMMKQLDKTVANLTDLKVAIFQANQKAQRWIYDLAEKKSRLTWLASIPTKNGEYMEYGHGEKPVKYTATIRKTDVDSMTSQLEAEVDEIQDRLDKFNHTAEVEVDKDVMDRLPVFETK